MQSIILVLNAVLPVFLIIGLGYLIGKKITTDTQPIIDFIVYFAAPCLIISSVSKSNLELTNVARIFTAAIFIIIIQFVIILSVLKIRKSDKIGLSLSAAVGNTAYLGYPVALFAFGLAGLSNAIIYDIANGLFIFTIGIYILHYKNDIKEIFRLPLIYAILAGILLNIFHITIPEIISKPIEMIGAITLPLALLVLGYKITKIRIYDAKTSFFISCFRIFGGFLIGLLIVSLFNLSGIIKNIILLQCSMPSAVMSMILTHKYNRDSELAASAVLISTVMSIITIPLILFFML